MLRLLLRISTTLLIALTGIGLLLARSWGWSEYASNELYLLYAQLENGAPSAYFLIDTNGSNIQWRLAPEEGDLLKATCSPDGRTLAYLLSDGDLTVANQGGVIYHRTLGLGYDALAVANNGTLAISKQDYGIALVVTADNITSPRPPDHIAYDPLKVSSSGNTLWSHTMQGGIKLLAPSGETLLTVAPSASDPNWLAGEQIFTYTDYQADTSVVGGAVDLSRQLVAPIHRSLLPLSILSPDARLAVVRYVSADRSREQLYLVDPLTSQPKQQLTDDNVFHLPICFLTFRPTMLIAGS